MGEMLTSGNNRASICEEWRGKIGQGNREARREKEDCGERSIVKNSLYVLVGWVAAVPQCCTKQSWHLCILIPLLAGVDFLERRATHYER